MFSEKLKKKQRVLIIDDDEEDRNLIRLYLEKSGYTDILQAASGTEGIRKARKMKPDVIVIDTVLPDIDGFGVCRTLSNDHSVESKFLVMTGVAQFVDIEKALAEGADSYCLKSFTFESVVREILQLLKGEASPGQKPDIHEEREP